MTESSPVLTMPSPVTSSDQSHGHIGRSSPLAGDSPPHGEIKRLFVKGKQSLSRCSLYRIAY